MGLAPLHKRCQEAEPSGVQSFHLIAKAHAVTKKASLGSNGFPMENEATHCVPCGLKPTLQSEWLCFPKFSCVYLWPFSSH
jgi:hypothetical protein